MYTISVTAVLDNTSRKWYFNVVSSNWPWKDSPLELHHTVARGCDHPAVPLITKCIVIEVQHPWYGQGWENSRTEVFQFKVPDLLNLISHLGLIHIHARISNIGRANRTYQVVTKVKSWGIPVIIFIHTGPLEIVLNIIAGNVTLHCRVVLYGNFSTVEYMR